jgi:hypothetical protein
MTTNDHTYTGEVYLDKHGYSFRYKQGKIASFDLIDAEGDECFDCPMDAYTGSYAILKEADEIAFGEWVQESREVNMITTKWQQVELDDDGEISNPEFVNAPNDSFWWVDSHNRLHTVMMKSAIYFRPSRIAKVNPPESV